MTPTLRGRLETRLLMMLTVGLVWTILVSPALPGPTGEVYRATFYTWFVVMVVGTLVWEPIYHGLMQFRWEKDWPAFFGFWTGVNEGILAYVLLRSFGPDTPDVGGTTFVLHFTSVWLLIWVASNGPLRIFLPHWRFRGAQVTDV